MRHRTIIAVLAAVLCSLGAAPGASAQVQERPAEPRYQRGDDDDRERSRRFALGLAAGVVEPDDEGEIYYQANFRIRLFDDDRERRDDDWRYASRGDIRAYLEPEVGYWERDETGFSESDLNVGINAIGVVPGQVVDYFFGVGLGLHFLDTKIDVADPAVPDVDESDSHFGGNFQVGLDIHLGRAVSLYGAGRFDVIEGLDETLQGKVYMGLRFWF
ncbi:MAG TPA: hypothetical protein VLF66_02390 [Thermoanaerobaculia bacterium]|nr:hypothetical protein [Thermoanaerobaculia bacterium]